jgi:hypothetical protein
MRRFILALAASAALASPALAQVSEDFNAEGNTRSILNWPGNSNLTVPVGSVDLVRSGNFGITCNGGIGSCIDLDGTTTSGGALQTANFTFSAGQIVTLSGLISGNQRNRGPDNFVFAFIFGGLTSGADFTGTNGDTSFNFGNFSNSLIQQVQGTVGASDPFNRYSIAFRALGSGTVAGRISNSGTDNNGPVLDDLSLSITAVPEPATWAMMILGFGVIGGALRRRQRPALAAA